MAGIAGVTISLTLDEALVLFDLLTRESGKEALPTMHQAERNVLWGIEAHLEKSLVEPLRPNYNALVSAARQRLVAGSD